MRSRVEAAPVICLRHPTAASHRGHCAACLLEDALAPEPLSGPLPEEKVLTIQVPLGGTASSSVFLVKADGPSVRLLRLKTWHIAAPRDFMPRFERLQRQLSAWNHEALPGPLAACVDAAGHPSVLSEFNQGLPIVERVESGAMDAETAVACLTKLRELTCRAHERGLVHGRIVSSNVIVGPGDDRAFLLDFGHAALIGPDGSGPPGAAGDMAGFDRLIHTVQTLSAARSRRP